MPKSFCLCAALLCVLLAGCAGGERRAEPGAALAPCQLSAPGTAQRLAAECTTVRVFEDRAAASGRTIDLRVAVVPAVSRSAAPDPLFFLTGGPGQAATESYVLLAPAFDAINQERDIVLVDQRGTGMSNPLKCPEEVADQTDARAVAEACLRDLDADPRFYTTSVAADDLDQVRAALGYEQINLYGVSYGTRAALTYLQRHGARVRSAILDGVVPQDQPLGLYVARDAQRALDLTLERCSADPDCRAAFPELRAELDALLERLGRDAPTVRIADPVSAAPTEITLTREVAAQTIRLLSYAPETVALLPLLIHSAAGGELGPLAAQAHIAGDSLGESISGGMNTAVLCSEDTPFIDPAAAAQAGAGSYLGDAPLDWQLGICAAWPRGEVPAEFKRPVASDVPVLLLSGEADPVTPPANAEQAARTLPNSLSLVAPGMGHNVIARGCIPRLADRFIDQVNPRDLPADCLEEITPLPFFTNWNN
ncbi:MAG TPA: alpha/beta hydrolase [Roseiflexaceae bacterium]|nr:alpha/beta hydrolase [Roseiflexaceae bacterium]